MTLESQVWIVWSSVPKGQGATFATALVEQGVAACVQVLESSASVYYWDQRIEQTQEDLLMCKTARPDALVEALRAMHPYDVPEILVQTTASDLNDPRYARWVNEESAGRHA